MTWTLRPAAAGDVDALATYEVDISRVSFGEDAVDDPAVHVRKLLRGLEKDPAGMTVADDGGRVVGWVWVAINTNFLTRERYANFRSLAVDTAHEDRAAIGDALMTYALEHATGEGATYIVGRVGIDNVTMRTLYRKYAFDPAHLTMHRSLP